MGRVKTGCPVLPAANVQDAMAYCCQRLGFEVGGDHGDYGVINRDGAELHYWQCDDPKIAHASSAYFIVEGIQDLFDEVAPAVGAGVAVPLAKQPYGMWEFIVRDPDGNLLKFGEPTKEAA